MEFRKKITLHLSELVVFSFAMLGILGMLYSAIHLTSALRFMSGTATAKGWITSCSYDYSSSASVLDDNTKTTFYKATIRFVTATEHSVTFRNPDDVDLCKVGQQVSVSYHPDNPQDARIADSSPLAPWLQSLILLGFFVVWSSIPLWLTIRFCVKAYRDWRLSRSLKQPIHARF